MSLSGRWASLCSPQENKGLVNQGHFASDESQCLSCIQPESVHSGDALCCLKDMVQMRQAGPGIEAFSANQSRWPIKDLCFSMSMASHPPLLSVRWDVQISGSLVYLSFRHTQKNKTDERIYFIFFKTLFIDFCVFQKGASITQDHHESLNPLPTLVSKLIDQID